MSAKPVVFTSIAPTVRASCVAYGSQQITTIGVVCSDILALSLVFSFAVLGRHLVTPTYKLLSYFDMLPYLLLLLAGFWIQGLYPGILLHPAEEMRRVFLVISVVFLLMGSTTFLWRSAEEYSRAVFLISWSTAIPLMLLTRYFVRKLLSGKPWWGVPAIVLGSGPVAQRVVRRLRDGMLGVKIVGVLHDGQILSWAEDLPPLLGDLSCAPSLVRDRGVQYVIIAMPQQSNIELRHSIQDYCRGFSHVLFVPDLVGLCSSGISAREIGGEVGFEFPQRLFHRSASVSKRTLDLAIAGLALLTLWPLFLLIPIAIKLSSCGPVFYRQARYGRKGEIFEALKFRTMAPDSEEVLQAHLAAYPESRFEWQRDHKLRVDPRVTKVGKWLRRFSLDELPQLLNVLGGQMSLVGPRPIVDSEIQKYGRGYGLYTCVRPGVTGLWQVSGRNNTTYDERVSFDEYYVRNWSIWLDLYIVTRTIKVVLTAEGAY